MKHLFKTSLAGLLAAANGAKKEDFGALSAFYLKKSQAEEERERAEK